MFSLVVTIISITLVAALVVATAYYGGDIYNAQGANAAAATLDNQAQQIYAAAMMFDLEHGSWPANVALLAADSKYLSSMPTPATGLLTTAGGLPSFTSTLQPISAYLGDGDAAEASASALVSAFPRLSQADARVLAVQLWALAARSGTAAAEKVLQLMEKERVAQEAHLPSALDYTWPAATTQQAANRFIWIPLKVNRDTCIATNEKWRADSSIPERYTPANGAIQCFGNATSGYSYLWLSPGSVPAAVAVDLEAAGAAIDWEGVAAADVGGSTDSTGGTSGASAGARPATSMALLYITADSYLTVAIFEVSDTALEEELTNGSLPLAFTTSDGLTGTADKSGTYTMNSVVRELPYVSGGRWAFNSSSTSLNYWWGSLGTGAGAATAYYSPSKKQLRVEVEHWNNTGGSLGSLDVKLAGRTLVGLTFNVDGGSASTPVDCGYNWFIKAKVGPSDALAPFVIKPEAAVCIEQ